MKTLSTKRKLEVAGVGHRSISSDREELKAEIKAFLSELTDTYDVVVRTCFARGADQLIAESALELGLTVKAALPFPYEDFIAYLCADAAECGEAFTEDDELHARHLLAETVTCKTIVDKTEPFLAASRYIVEKCDVLLALWDGVETPLVDKNGKPINKGGTFDTICEARKMNKSVRIIPCKR